MKDEMRNLSNCGQTHDFYFYGIDLTLEFDAQVTLEINFIQMTLNHTYDEIFCVYSIKIDISKIFLIIFRQNNVMPHPNFKNLTQLMSIILNFNKNLT